MSFSPSISLGVFCKGNKEFNDKSGLAYVHGATYALGVNVRGVGLDVAQKIQESSGGLLGPANLVTRGGVLLGDGVSADATGVLGERDGILELQNVLQVFPGILQGSALDGLANFTAVLEVDSDVSALGLGGCDGGKIESAHEQIIESRYPMELTLGLIGNVLAATQHKISHRNTTGKNTDSPVSHHLSQIFSLWESFGERLLVLW